MADPDADSAQVRDDGRRRAAWALHRRRGRRPGRIVHCTHNPAGHRDFRSRACAAIRAGLGWRPRPKLPTPTHGEFGQERRARPSCVIPGPPRQRGCRLGFQVASAPVATNNGSWPGRGPKATRGSGQCDSGPCTIQRLFGLWAWLGLRLACLGLSWLAWLNLALVATEETAVARLFSSIAAVTVAYNLLGLTVMGHHCDRRERSPARFPIAGPGAHAQGRC